MSEMSSSMSSRAYSASVFPLRLASSDNRRSISGSRSMDSMTPPSYCFNHPRKVRTSTNWSRPAHPLVGFAFPREPNVHGICDRDQEVVAVGGFDLYLPLAHRD